MYSSEINNKGIDKALKSIWFRFPILVDKNMGKAAISLINRALRFISLG